MISSGFETRDLGEVVSFSTDRISANALNQDNYVSTENMLPNIGGKVNATTIPSGSVIKYIKGQTLLSNIRPYFKKIWYANNNGGCSQDVLVINSTQKIDNEYLFYYLNQQNFFDYVMAGAKGTKMPRGDKSHILKFKISYPSLNEQRQIAKLFRSIDNKIELNNKINNTLEEMAQAIFKSWFVDFEPFKDGEFTNSKVGKFPKEWQLSRIGDLSIIVTDFVANGSFASLKENVQLYESENYAYFIRNVDLKANDFRKFVDKESYEFLSKSSLEGGELIISNVGDVGSVYLCPKLDKPMTLGNNIIVIKSKNKGINYNIFLYLLFKYNYGADLLVNITSGSAQPKFNKTDFKNLQIITPDIKTLNKFNELVSDLINQQENLKKEISLLTKIRDSLLPKLMSGEIRVPLEEVPYAEVR